MFIWLYLRMKASIPFVNSGLLLCALCLIELCCLLYQITLLEVIGLVFHIAADVFLS